MRYSVKNKIPKIIMPICDETIFTLKMSSFLFDKYWPNNTKIDVLGFTKPDFKISDKMTFISLDNYQKEGSKGWSKYILKHLKTIEDEEIILTLEDFFPTSKPNLNLINKVAILVENSKNIGRFDLTYDSYIYGDFKILNEINTLKILSKEKFSNYRISTQPSLWNKDFLMKILSQTTSPWDFEINGTKMSNQYDKQILAFGDETYKNFPTYWIHKGAVSRQHPGKINVLGLDCNTIREMVQLKLFEERDLVWGMFNNIKSPSFADLGGYNFDPRRMPDHEASRTKWKEYHNVYLKEKKK